MLFCHPTENRQLQCSCAIDKAMFCRQSCGSWHNRKTIKSLKVVARVKPLGEKKKKHDLFSITWLHRSQRFSCMSQVVKISLLFNHQLLVEFLVWENSPENTSNIHLQVKQIQPWKYGDNKIIENVGAKTLDKAYQFAKILRSDVHEPWNCLKLALDK